MRAENCLTIAVCDDHHTLLAQVEQLLARQLAGLPHRIMTFAGSDALLRAAAGQSFQLAILDIRLPDQEDGITLAQRLLALQPGCQIIFLTAYVAYCQDVYDVAHVAFVLKEEMSARLPVAVARACTRLAAAPRPAGGARLLLGEPGDATQLFQADIIFLERRVRTTWVHTLQGQAATGEKLESLLARLAPDAFCQTHKSFAVHWPMVEQYGKTLIRLSGGVQVPISRRYAARVRQSFLRYVTALQGGPAGDGEAPP